MQSRNNIYNQKNMITTVSEENLLESLNADPVGTFDVLRTGKAAAGCNFFDTVWKINGQQTNGWFTVKNVVIGKGIADPDNKEDPRNKFASTRLVFQTTVKNCGAIGKALLALEPRYQSIIKSMISEGVIDPERKGIHVLVQDKIVSKGEKRGQPIDNPIIRFKIDFKPYSSKHPIAILRGQPQTLIYDADKQYVNEKGVICYKLATVVVDGKEVPLSAENVHLFVTPGSVIVNGRFSATTVAESGSWISMPLLMNKAVIRKGVPAIFDDDAVECEDAVESLSMSTQPTSTSTTSTSTTSTSTTASNPLDECDLDDLINDEPDDDDEDSEEEKKKTAAKKFVSKIKTRSS